jgi:hypothetical protein
MEACVGAHHISRKLQTLGHNARLMRRRNVAFWHEAAVHDVGSYVGDRWISRLFILTLIFVDRDPRATLAPQNCRYATWLLNPIPPIARNP